MTEILFYHLERAGLHEVLPELLEKSLQRGWRVLVRTGADEAATRLDAMLWTYTDESFLPHGTDEQADQPIFLSGDGEPADALAGRQILFLVEGGEADPAAIGDLTRCIRIFDGGDEAALGAARTFWKSAKAAGHEATYWRQSPQGRWEKQG